MLYRYGPPQRDFEPFSAQTGIDFNHFYLVWESEKGVGLHRLTDED